MSDERLREKPGFSTEPGSKIRIVLHTGKGGTGKTTISAATAVAAADAGHRTLLLSTHPAHSLADVLHVEVGPEPGPVPGIPNLWAAQPDTGATLEQSWPEIRRYLVGVLGAGGMAKVQAEELTVPPGSDDIAALLAVHRYGVGTDPNGTGADANGTAFDVLVVDCASTAGSLRLLALPETMKFYGDRLRTPSRLIRTLAAGVRRHGDLREALDPVDRGPLTDLVGSLIDTLISVRDLLADSAVTGIRLVVTPERVVIAEARRLFTALGLHGFPVEAVVVNRLLPASVGGTDLGATWLRQQLAILPLIAESFPHLQMQSVEMAAAEPVGISALRLIAEQLFDGSDPVARLKPSGGVRTEGENGRYRLLIPLPLAERRSVDLARSGDELVVTVGPMRRRVTLPSTLRRCRTSGARFDGDTLIIEFEADQRLWPAALAASLTDIDHGSKQADQAAELAAAR